MYLWAQGPQSCLTPGSCISPHVILWLFVRRWQQNLMNHNTCYPAKVSITRIPGMLGGGCWNQLGLISSFSRARQSFIRDTKCSRLNPVPAFTDGTAAIKLLSQGLSSYCLAKADSISVINAAGTLEKPYCTTLLMGSLHSAGRIVQLGGPNSGDPGCGHPPGQGSSVLVAS